MARIYQGSGCWIFLIPGKMIGPKLTLSYSLGKKLTVVVLNLWVLGEYLLLNIMPPILNDSCYIKPFLPILSLPPLCKCPSLFSELNFTFLLLTYILGTDLITHPALQVGYQVLNVGVTKILIISKALNNYDNISSFLRCCFLTEKVRFWNQTRVWLPDLPVAVLSYASFFHLSKT